MANRQRVVSIDRAPWIDDGTMWVSSQEAQPMMKTSEGSRRRRPHVAREATASVPKVALCEALDVHYLAKNFCEGASIFLVMRSELGSSGWKHLSQVRLEFVVCAEGRVDSLEALA